MSKAIIASFIGTFLALAAIGVITFVVVDRAVDRVVNDISSRVAERVAAVREQASSLVESARERSSAGVSTLAAALDAGRGKRELLVAFGECIQKRSGEGTSPAAAVEGCLQEYAWVEP